MPSASRTRCGSARCWAGSRGGWWCSRSRLPASTWARACRRRCRPPCPASCRRCSENWPGTRTGLTVCSRGCEQARRSAMSASCSMPTGGDPSITPMIPRPRPVTATSTSTWLAVAQKIVQTSGTALSGFSTLTGKPSLSRITNAWPAPMASAFAAARPVSSASLPDRRTSRAEEASQNATPKRRCGLTPASASCRSSTVLMKWAWPMMTFMSAGLSTGTTSRDTWAASTGQ